LHSAGLDPWQLGLLAERYPTLSVLHDFWLLTGRCAYPAPCTKYKSGCDETCPTATEYPRLDPDKIADAWKRKQKLLFSDNQLMLLGNSRWTCEVARETMATTGNGRRGRPVEQFRLSFPLEIFRPKDKAACRATLELPADRFIVLLSGDLYDPRKNTRLALDALASLRLPDLTVVSLGQTRDDEGFASLDLRRMGRINDPERLATLYAAADLYVAPSREETFGQVFIESIACGTPVIGVRATGTQEAVVERMTGLLVDEFSTEALAEGIYELYRKPEWRRQMGQWGRIYVQNEWSPQASYYHMFQAWRKLGILERLQIPEKITFLGTNPGLPQVRTIHRREGLTTGPTSLGSE
jgi:glycosyltransferase involved in cell wall biosynthesis